MALLQMSDKPKSMSLQVAESDIGIRINNRHGWESVMFCLVQ